MIQLPQGTPWSERRSCGHCEVCCFHRDGDGHSWSKMWHHGVRQIPLAGSDWLCSLFFFRRNCPVNAGASGMPMVVPMVDGDVSLLLASHQYCCSRLQGLPLGYSTTLFWFYHHPWCLTPRKTFDLAGQDWFLQTKTKGLSLGFSCKASQATCRFNPNAPLSKHLVSNPCGEGLNPETNQLFMTWTHDGVPAPPRERNCSLGPGQGPFPTTKTAPMPSLSGKHGV